ncbi:MAG TPA: RNA polymerase sigma factor [Myxococcota bacterium]|nr:RNA polymerase sigma factor [Myxococcota bacterium]
MHGVVDDLFRREYGRVLATVLRLVGDVDRAEELVQEALVAALERWPFSGVPDNPGAWLMTTARNRALDHLRREKRFGDRRDAIAREQAEAQEPASDGRGAQAAALADPHTGEGEGEGGAAAGPPGAVRIPDDRLRLIFLCCHPALSKESQVALTLRLVAGLSTEEIARAFLTSEPTIAQRLVRAKRTIRDQRLPYAAPEPSGLEARLAAVLEVLYLVFNEGYTARAGDALVRHELCREAIRLADLLAELLPEQPEALGLAALLKLHASRGAARTDAEGQLVLLPEQDRARWDHTQIAAGGALLERALTLGAPGPYVLQAAIAGCHAQAASWAATDWRAIAALYERLRGVAPSPIVDLNHAVAVSMVEGPAAGLARVDALESLPALRDYHLLPATRADMFRRLGRLDEAAREYERALALAHNDAERAFLRRRLDECRR